MHFEKYDEAELKTLNHNKKFDYCDPLRIQPDR